MFKVEIKNLSISANIGITAQERKKKQLLKVTLEFSYPVKNSLDLNNINNVKDYSCLLYTSPSPRDVKRSRMPSSA